MKVTFATISGQVHSSLTDVPKNIKSISSKSHVGFYCPNCASIHVLTKKAMNSVKTRIRSSADEELKARAFKILQPVGIEKYCYRVLETLPEWKKIDVLIKKQEASFAGFAEYICSYSESKQAKQLVRVACSTHPEGHYIPKKDVVTLRNEVNFSDQGYAIAKSWGELGRKAVTRALTSRASNILFNEASNGSQKRQEAPQEPQQSRNEQVVVQKNKHPLSASEVTVDASQFIIPPALLSEDLAVEFYMCGRKNMYLTEAEAWVAMKYNGSSAEYSPYKCLHCEGYHYGHNIVKLGTAKQYTKKGKLWYRKFPDKANRFIHRLLFS
jgi:hypothetical protein